MATCQLQVLRFWHERPKPLWPCLLHRHRLRRPMLDQDRLIFFRIDRWRPSPVARWLQRQHPPRSRSQSLAAREHSPALPQHEWLAAPVLQAVLEVVSWNPRRAQQDSSSKSASAHSLPLRAPLWSQLLSLCAGLPARFVVGATLWIAQGVLGQTRTSNRSRARRSRRVERTRSLSRVIDHLLLSRPAESSRRYYSARSRVPAQPPRPADHRAAHCRRTTDACVRSRAVPPPRLQARGSRRFASTTWNRCSGGSVATPPRRATTAAGTRRDR